MSAPLEPTFKEYTMVLTPSTMLPLGTKAPSFSLPNVDGRTVSLEEFRGAPALLVVFMCNHCPYVKHVAEGLAKLARDYQADSPEQMVREVEERGYSFPYLYDETQEVAKSYRAACTPDFYLFDKNQKLVYRGQMDDSRPGSEKPVTGADLRAALDAVLAGRDASPNQRSSIGCNIKWKPGNEPDYFG
jgi:peroxiredoxin